MFILSQQLLLRHAHTDHASFPVALTAARPVVLTAPQPQIQLSRPVVPGPSSQGPPFKFDRNAQSVREIWLECQRYMETRATADTVRALGISRSEERYINARLVIKHEVEHIMASHLVAVDQAIQQLADEQREANLSMSKFIALVRARHPGKSNDDNDDE